jgi:hypothetical protein
MYKLLIIRFRGMLLVVGKNGVNIGALEDLVLSTCSVKRKE